MKLNSAYLTMYLGRTRCIVRHTLHQAHARHPASGIRQPSAVSRRTYRAILGFHTQMRLSLSFRHSNPGRQYETIQGSVAPIYLPSFLPSFPRWKSPGRPRVRIKLTHPSSVSRDFEVSKPSFELRVSTARLSFWATYIAFFYLCASDAHS